MNYSVIKNLISKFVGGITNTSHDESLSPEKPVDHLVLKITDTYDRIEQSDTVAPAMKDYAFRLIYAYLPAIECSHHALTANPNDKILRLNKSVDGMRNDSLEQIEACLIDIEHGAVFKDNLGDVFLNALLDFEAKLEGRVVD